MSTLKTLIALHARVFTFLEGLDEETILAIVRGEVSIAVNSAHPINHDVGAAHFPRVVSDEWPGTTDPAMVELTVRGKTTRQERIEYLTRHNFTMPVLSGVAKRLGIRKYSGLRKAELLQAIGEHQLNEQEDDIDVAETSDVAGSPNVPPSSESQTYGDSTNAHASPEDLAAIGTSGRTAEIATKLREIQSITEGAEYLRSQHLDRAGLLAVAGELKLTRLDRLNSSDLEQKILKQAIGARLKFAGLRRW